MHRRESLTLFMRLVSHFPALGGDDSGADVRLEDWCNAIEHTDPDNARQTIAEFVNHWPTDAGIPKIGDFQESCRRIAAHRAIPSARELEPTPEILPDPERLAELVELARQALTKKGRAA